MTEPKVLFATDLSGDVDGGLALATRMARERAATLVVMHVIPLEVNGGEGLLHQAVDLRSGRSEQRLKRLVPEDPGVPFLHVLEAGAPEERIATFVERQQVALLVMEGRRRSGLKRALTRSLNERLVDRVGCPVVTFRAGSGASVGRGLLSMPPSVTPSHETLTTILNARVSALATWMELQREATRRIAAASSVRDAVASLYRAERFGHGTAFIPSIRELLRLELAEHQRALGALGVEVLSNGQPLMQLGLGPRRDSAYLRFLERLSSQQGAVSVPLHPAASGREVSCVLVAGAPMVFAGHEAQLLFTLDARRDFLRILAQPGPHPSVETYAFDDTGIMLSNSRFPDQLRRIGLLPPGAQTPRLLRVSDPGGNLLAGEVQLATMRSLETARPLTRMAAAAIGGTDGSDWNGYRDYRGVEVVGAWRWLAECGFGVAAEMDREA